MHHLGVGHYCGDKVHGGDAHDQPKNGFAEAVYSACGEMRISDPQMGYGCKPLEGQNSSHKAHMPGFILPQVFRVIYCLCCLCEVTTSGVN